MSQKITVSSGSTSTSLVVRFEFRENYRKLRSRVDVIGEFRENYRKLTLRRAGIRVQFRDEFRENYHNITELESFGLSLQKITEC